MVLINELIVHDQFFGFFPTITILVNRNTLYLCSTLDKRIFNMNTLYEYRQYSFSYFVICLLKLQKVNRISKMTNQILSNIRMREN